MPRRPDTRRERDRPKRACLKCKARTIRVSQVCRNCDPPPVAARPERRCRGCDRTTTRVIGWCRACEPIQAGYREPEAAHALAAPEGHQGAWVNVQGVRRWLTWPTQDVA